MICPRCGKNVTDGYNFCPNCGAQLTTTNSNISPIHSKEAFYKKTWVLVLACVLLPPLGIAFLWMAKRPKNVTLRIFITILLVILCINFLLVKSLFIGEKCAKEKPSVNNEIQVEDTSNDIVQEAEEHEEYEKTEKTSMVDFDVHDCHVKYLRASIEENYINKPCLVVYFEFTNNADQNKSFDNVLDVLAFQDGVELKESDFQVNDETRDRSVAIQPGTTITVASAYTLRNNLSEITLEGGTWTSEEPIASITIPVPEQ